MLDNLAGLDDRLDQVGAVAVEDVVEVVRIPEQQVGLLAGFDGADPVRAADGCGGVQGGGGEGLLRGHAVAVAGDIHRQLQREVRGGAGVKVGGDGDRNPRLDHLFGRRKGGSQIEGGGRQQAGDGAALCHRGDALVRADDQVLGRHRADLTGKLGAADGVDLVSVDFGPEPQLLRRGQDAL